MRHAEGFETGRLRGEAWPGHLQEDRRRQEQAGEAGEAGEWAMASIKARRVRTSSGTS